MANCHQSPRHSDSYTHLYETFSERIPDAAHVRKWHENLLSYLKLYIYFDGKTFQWKEENKNEFI